FPSVADKGNSKCEHQRRRFSREPVTRNPLGWSRVTRIGPPLFENVIPGNNVSCGLADPLVSACTWNSASEDETNVANRAASAFNPSTVSVIIGSLPGVKYMRISASTL